MRPSSLRRASSLRSPSSSRFPGVFAAATPLAAIAALILTHAPSPAQAQQRTLCVHGIEAPATLNVRDGPGLDNRVIAQFPAKACGVRLAGRCAGTWCVMALGKTSGWVDTKHIGVYEQPRASVATVPQPDVISPVTETVAPPAGAPFTAPADVAVAPPAKRSIVAERPHRRTPVRARAAVEQASADDDGTCVRRVDRDDTLRIRRGPGVDHDEIGDIPPKACGVSVSDACDGRWCKISWRGRRGWVNTYYLD